jgi:5,10-methylene-tetrahydrofolate dehydrogenase/methenyl tetrahydrofolate cyclohydrolase
MTQTARLLDGKAHATRLRADITSQIQALHQTHGVTPTLAAILVGDDPATQSYWRNNRKACEEVGISALSFTLPADTSQSELDELILTLNTRPDVHGILLHAPLPSPLDSAHTVRLIDPAKDVDGANPATLGQLADRSHPLSFAPATPAGVMRLLELEQIPLRGRSAVVIGRSRVVGLPLSLLLLRQDATVTITHSQTVDLPSVCRQADVLISAIGRPHLVTAEWVKPGATVIDVGINRVDDPANPGKTRMVGDVDFEAVKAVAGAISPVPGGVGPMTVAMLLDQTLRAARNQLGL